MRRGWEIEKINLTPAIKEEPTGVPLTKFQKFKVAIKKHWLKSLLITLCVYFIFVLFGMLITDYYIDENGYRQPIKASFSYLEQREDYKQLYRQYSEICDLMVDITVVDIHLANKKYTDMESVTYYTKLLNERVDILIPKITALEMGEEQTVIQETMNTLLSNDTAVYLQKIIEGLRSGNSETIQTALVWRDKAFSSFEVLRTDMSNLARRVKADYKSIDEWKLDKAVLKKDSTAILMTSE